MAQPPKKATQAEEKNPETGARKRTSHATPKQAVVAKARSLVRENDYDQNIESTSFSQAGAKLIARLSKFNKQRARTFEPVLALHLYPLLGPRLLRRITRSVLERTAQSILDLPLSRKYKKQIISLMIEVVVIGYGKLEPPIRRASQLSTHLQFAPWGSKSLFAITREVPFGEVIDRRLELAKGMMAIVMILLIEFGLRIGEVLALCCCDIRVDPEDGKLYLWISQAQKRDRALGQTKTIAGNRKIPILSDTAQHFADWIAEQKLGPADRLLGVRPAYKNRPEGNHTYGSVVYQHNKFQREIGGPVFCLHQYRGGCVTQWLIADVGMATVMRWIGHANLATTAEYYVGAILLADEIWLLQNLDNECKEGPRAKFERELMLNLDHFLPTEEGEEGASVAVTGDAGKGHFALVENV